jgi:peptidoglycan/LPS O-acetylase OafA/YrhL
MPRPPAARPDFRTDINGLRAWAVAMVVLFHFHVPGFAGGFVGVDVFFVISGFLMTGIVADGLASPGGFRLGAFVWARGRRILPALVVLCAAMLVLGWWMLPPPDYQRLGTQVASACLFISNVYFRGAAGYFSPAAHEQWLLHTWSLSVEWQFYLLLPIALMAAWALRPRRGTLLAVVAAGLALSFAWAIWQTVVDANVAFYLLPSRAWEMLAGGVVRLLPAARHSRRFEAAGFALIAASVVGFDAASAWPGWRAALPVAGTALVLAAARAPSPWTGSRLAQWLGTRSYSIYLWHWPVAVALAYQGRQDDPLAVAAGLAFTLLAGHLSHAFVETGSGDRLKALRPATAVALLAGATAAVASSGVGLRFANGWQGRLPSAVDAAAAEARNFNPRRTRCHLDLTGVASPSCTYGDGPLAALVIGDSHGDTVVTALAAAAPGRGVMQWTYSGCPFVRGVAPSPRSPMARSAGFACDQFVDWALARLDDVPRDVPVVLVHRASFYAHGTVQGDGEPMVSLAETPPDAFLATYTARLTETACRLAAQRPTCVMRPVPEMRVDVPSVTARSLLGHGVPLPSIPLSDYQRRNAQVLRAQDAAHARCGVRLFDPVPFLCADGNCPGTFQGRPAYTDSDHLSEWGNRRLVPMFAAVFATAR